MKHNITWFDVPVTDLDRAIRFYSAVLGSPVTKEKNRLNPNRDTPDTGRSKDGLFGLEQSGQAVFGRRHGLVRRGGSSKRIGRSGYGEWWENYR